MHFDVLRWARVVVDCDGCDTMEDLQVRLREALAAARTAETADRGLIARVTLSGATSLAGTLADSQSQLRDDARAHAGAISPDLWIEKVQVRTSTPVAAVQAELSEDVAALLASAARDGELLEALAQELAPFLVATAAAQPPEEDDMRHAASVGDWSGVAQAAASGLLVRLGRAG